MGSVSNNMLEESYTNGGIFIFTDFFYQNDLADSLAASLLCPPMQVTGLCIAWSFTALIPITSKNVTYLLIEVINLCVKNTRDS